MLLIFIENLEKLYKPALFKKNTAELHRQHIFSMVPAHNVGGKNGIETRT